MFKQLAIFFDLFDVYHLHEIDDEMLQSFIEDFIIMYLDDILIYSYIWEEYVEHIMSPKGAIRKQDKANFLRNVLPRDSNQRRGGVELGSLNLKANMCFKCQSQVYL